MFQQSRNTSIERSPPERSAQLLTRGWARRYAANIAKLPECLANLERRLAQSALTWRSVRLRRFGSPLGDSSEFRSGPSPHSADMRNRPCGRRCHERGDNGLSLVSFRNKQEVGFAG